MRNQNARAAAIALAALTCGCFSAPASRGDDGSTNAASAAGTAGASSATGSGGALGSSSGSGASAASSGSTASTASSSSGSAAASVSSAASSSSGSGGVAASATGGSSGGPTCPPGYALSNGSCQDIDECASADAGCDVNATCANTPGSYTCTCDFGFTGDGFSCAPLPQLRPAPPSGSDVMWQGQQLRFIRPDGGLCEGRVALAVGGRSVCYAAADAELRCAGSIYTQNFGPSFADTGLGGVDQILLSGTFNSSDGDAICVHTTDGGAACMGDMNSHGQFGDGTQSASSTFVSWPGAELVALTTGTWDQLCAIDALGGVFCSGLNFGDTPVQQGPGTAHASVWVDTFGAVHLDDPATWRPGEVRTDCVIGAQGLDCGGGGMGTPGQVVSGGTVAALPGSGPPMPCLQPLPSCWLESDGAVHCSSCDMAGNPVSSDLFSGQPVLALGLSGYSDVICAVFADGSLSCVGGQVNGPMPPALPAGTVDVGCH